MTLPFISGSTAGQDLKVNGQTVAVQARSPWKGGFPHLQRCASGWMLTCGPVPPKKRGIIANVLNSGKLSPEKDVWCTVCV